MNKNGEILKDFSNPKLIDKIPYSLGNFNTKKSALNLNIYFFDMVINE